MRVFRLFILKRPDYVGLNVLCFTTPSEEIIRLMCGYDVLQVTVD